MSISIQVLRNDFPKIGRGLEGRVADINTKAAFDCIAAAAPLTPVDTGALKNSGAVSPGNAANPTATVSWAQAYAPHVELGTARMAAQPFARPAAEQVKPGWIAALSQAVQP